MSDVNYFGKYLNGDTDRLIIKDLIDVNLDGLLDWNDYKILKRHIEGEANYETLPIKYELGDANKDFVVDARDVNYFGRYLNGIDGNYIIESAVDLNKDFVVDWEDYKLLKKLVV